MDYKDCNDCGNTIGCRLNSKKHHPALCEFWEPMPESINGFVETLRGMIEEDDMDWVSSEYLIAGVLTQSEIRGLLSSGECCHGWS